MLFDLRGRGRRTTIKIIYVTLAVLMGGGLVLFGIGGDVSGGLVDAITERGVTGDDTEERLQKRETDALARTRTNPRDVAAWQELVRAREALARTGDRFDQEKGTYSPEGQAELREAAAAWEKLIALDPPEDQDLSRVASIMYRVYLALRDLENAARAQEVVAEVRESAGTYSTLAVVSYQAGLTRKGDLAAQRALDLTEPDMRENLKADLEQAKRESTPTIETPSETEE